MRRYITDDDIKKAAENGIKEETLIQRVRVLKWDVDKAVTTPINAHHTKKKLWQEWKEIAEANGISYQCWMARIKKMKLSPEDAATKPYKKKVSKIVTLEEREIMKQNGLSLKTVQGRLSRGWDKKKAITTPPDARFRKVGNK